MQALVPEWNESTGSAEDHIQGPQHFINDEYAYPCPQQYKQEKEVPT